MIYQNSLSNFPAAELPNEAGEPASLRTTTRSYLGLSKTLLGWHGAAASLKGKLSLSRWKCTAAGHPLAISQLLFVSDGPSPCGNLILRHFSGVR